MIGSPVTLKGLQGTIREQDMRLRELDASLQRWNESCRCTCEACMILVEDMTSIQSEVKS